MAIAGLVLGILGVLLSFVPCVGSYAVLLAVPGIVFSALGIRAAKKTNNGKGMAIAGLVLSIIGTVIAIYWMCVIGAVAGEVGALLTN